MGQRRATTRRTVAPARPLLGAIALVLAIGACSSGTGDDQASPDGTSPSPTSTTSSAAPLGSAPATTDDTSIDRGPTTGGSTPGEESAAGTSLAIPAPAETAEQLAQPWVILRAGEPGDAGPDVEALQQQLARFGLGGGTVDGSYGRRTEAAVSAFQDLVGLPVTGVADASTVQALAVYDYDGPVVIRGDEGESVERLQARLADGPFDPGPVDGVYGGATVQAVWALEKLAGLPVDGSWGPLEEQAWERLTAGELGRPDRDHDQRWVEVDLSQQLAKVYDPGATTPTLVAHVSTGSGIPWSNEDHSGSSITPKGEFHISRRISGWRESSLNIGRLYNPLYFNGGIAFHGATSVPLHPASHGCVRVPMHIAEYLPDELPNGTPVHVLA